MKKAAIYMALFISLLGSLSAQDKSRIIGFYGGWSLGVGDAFDTQYAGRHEDRDVLTFHIGTYYQINLAQNFGLQVKANFQNGIFQVNESSRYTEDSFNIISISINGVLYSKKSKNTQYYSSAGGGISTGDGLAYLHGLYYNLNIEIGAKHFLKSSNPNFALKFGISYHYLFDIGEEYLNTTASYFSLIVGVEF